MIFCWDDEPGANVEHIGEHGLTADEVESAFDDIVRQVRSRSSGRPAFFGKTYTGRTIFVVYEIDTDDDGEEFVTVVSAYERETDR